MRTELSRVTVTGPTEAMTMAAWATDDLRAAGKITGELTFTGGDGAEVVVDAVVAPQEPATT